MHYFHGMRTVSAAEANRSFSKLLREAGQGETIVITSHGSPVATIGPPPPATRRNEKLQALLQELERQPVLNLDRVSRSDLYDD